MGHSAGKRSGFNDDAACKTSLENPSKTLINDIMQYFDNASASVTKCR